VSAPDKPRDSDEVERRGRDHADRILRAAIAAADPAPLVTRALLAVPRLAGHQRVRVLAVGKAAAGMGTAALDTLGRLDARVTAALLILPHGIAAPGPRRGATVMHASHPLPDASSLDAGRAVERLLADAAADDVVLVLLSGGASALAVLPVDGLTVTDYAERIDRLMRDGADIGTINSVRRSIDRLKGGGMAAIAAPARVVGLVLSDVTGDRLETIASGPLTPDRASTSDVSVAIIGGNGIALDGAAACAAGLGYDVRRAAGPLTGPAREAGVWLAGAALRIQRGLKNHDRPVCLLAGGETTVVVTGDGVGGRNQELVLAAALEAGAAPGITIASAGTDGIDGPTAAAGAIADAVTLQRAAAAGIDAAAALARNDSYSFFRAVGGTFITGPTGTNVQDVQLALIRPEAR
jgi:glycerate 2-kinase